MKRSSAEGTSPAKKSRGPPSPQPEMNRMMPPIHIPPPILPYIDTTSPYPPTPSLTSSSSNTTALSPNQTNLPSPSTKPVGLPGQLGQASMSGNTRDGLEQAGYRQVWHWEVGFPGELPEDIALWIYPGIEKYMGIVGPLSSIFWLAGRPELCWLIEDRAYVLTDEICGIPHGASYDWLFGMLYDEGKIPGGIIYEMYEGPRKAMTTISGHEDIPTGVTDSMKEHSPVEIFPFSRSQSLPASVLMAKATLPCKFKDKNMDKIAADLEIRFTRSLGAGLLFRGMSRTMVQSLMAFFTPVLVKGNVNNEFGPGFYTTTSLQYALGYAGTEGVILVFKDPDFQRLKCLQLTGRDWETTTAFWTGRTMSNAQDRIAETWRKSDVLQGAVSAFTGSGTARAPGEYTQVVGTSPAALLALLASLKMIIWLQ
ncbi:hypothetical protein N7451_002410 [Penicillium sp. IBT 35674x]|nr:hypothetical protein N7451_002410 [Penicillium sp. IBT 35674x]